MLHIVCKEFVVSQNLIQIVRINGVISCVDNQNITACPTCTIRLPDFFQIRADISYQNIIFNKASKAFGIGGIICQCFPRSVLQ